MEEHGKVAADMLKNFLPDDALNARRAHNEKTGYKPEKFHKEVSKGLKKLYELSKEKGKKEETKRKKKTSKKKS